jgi:hypothetical protein
LVLIDFVGKDRYIDKQREIKMLFLLGCVIKSSVVLIEAEQAYYLVEKHKDIAPYEWNMADQYIKKAREEYGTSQLEDAEKLARDAVKWAQKVQEIADKKEGE